MGNIWVSFGVLGIFTLAHILSSWQVYRKQILDVGAGKPLNLVGYIRIHAPAKTPLSILSSIGLGLVLWDMGSLNVVTALTAGWSASSMVKKMSDMGGSML